MLKSLAGKVLAAKVLAIATSAVAVGGVAYAASTGDLPSPLHHSSHGAATAHATAHAKSAMDADKATKSADAQKNSAENRDAGQASKHPSASPSPSLVGLCHAWLARPADSGKADESPAFTYLINTAGGKSSVTTYCTKLLASKDHPAQSNKPSTPPGQAKKSDHPTGKPSSHPTGKPTSHPSGNPNSNGNSDPHHNGH